MIRSTSGPTDRPGISRIDAAADRTPRTDDREPSFDAALESQRARLSRRDQRDDTAREHDDDDKPEPNGAMLQAPQQPAEPRASRSAHLPGARAAVAVDDGAADPTALAAGDDPDPAANAPADPQPQATFELADVTVALSRSAEEALSARLAALLAAGEATAAPASTVALAAPSPALTLTLDGDLDLGDELAKDTDHVADLRAQADLRHPQAPDPTPQRVHALDATRPIADQVADAVRKLAAEVVDRPDVVRFRTPEFTFSAVIRHDGTVPQVRLLSDDPNTRAFLGERLPEVRQALTRVGFASTGLSVAADADRRRQDPRQDRDPHRDDPPDDGVDFVL